MSNLSLKSLEDQVAFKMTDNPVFSPGVNAGTTVASIKLGNLDDNITVSIGANGVPSVTSADNIGTDNQKAVAKAMAVVGMHLKGIGLTDANVKSIFENGITPTSLAAAESQLKGHHDAVLQLSLEALSRVTSVLQKISQKLSQ
jgi:hypothetical protein